MKEDTFWKFRYLNFYNLTDSLRNISASSLEQWSSGNTFLRYPVTLNFKRLYLLHY